MLAGNKKIRVMIVEDSPVQRRLLQSIVASHPRLQSVGAVSSGEAALQCLERLEPDVITMDIRLPGVSGIETTEQIMRRRPTPIVVVAAREASRANMSFDALRAGAVSVVEKPRASESAGLSQISERLCRQILLMSELKLVRRRRFRAPEALSGTPPSAVRSRHSGVAAVGLVASTGGPNALVEILTRLGDNFPVPVFLVQHMAASFHDCFVNWLDGLSPMPVVTASHGARPVPGAVHVAPASVHLEVANGRSWLCDAAPVASQRPSGTVLFRSLTAEYGAACAGVLLTGMGDDGAAGLREIFCAGGFAIAEDESTAAVFGMPAAAIRQGAVSAVLPLPDIAPRLRALAVERLTVAS